MRTPLKLAAYGGILAVAFAGALGTGSVIGSPVPTSSDMHSAGTHGIEAPHEGPDDAAADHGESHDADHGAENTQPAIIDSLPGGLMISDRGYTLDPGTGILAAGEETSMTFRILDAEGEPLTAFERSHDKDMHLIAVRSDTAGFQHVHPTLADDGTWSVPLNLTAGTWRIFADFVLDGDEALTLGADISVAGDYAPAEIPAASLTADVDGYTVTLDGDLVAGRESELTLTVSRDGEPVTDLEPYLAAYGHLVALRVGDLAYLHVHPAGTPGDGETDPGPGITFYATAPSTGDYRLYLDFQHDGVVRTAEFTATADRLPQPSTADTTADNTDADHEAEEDHAGH